MKKHIFLNFQKLLAWMKRKEQPRSATRLILNKLSEPRRLRHRDSPVAGTVSAALPTSRFTRQGVSARGDTVVEVMISVTILSLALAGAYSLGSASLRNGLAANQRTEALNLAQSQIELLSNAQTNDPNFASKYQVGTPYCINTDGTKNTSVGADQLCANFNGSTYNVGISYASSTKVFTITAQWNSTDGPGGKSKLNLYYKLPGSY